jgi:hypothetical protein
MIPDSLSRRFGSLWLLRADTLDEEAPFGAPEAFPRRAAEALWSRPAGLSFDDEALEMFDEALEQIATENQTRPSEPPFLKVKL